MQQLRNAENILKDQGTGIQDNRNLYNQVQDDVCDAEPELGAAVEAQADQLWNGGNTALQIAWCRPKCQYNQCSSSQNLKCHRAHANCPGLSVGSDQLFCGQVGQQQGTCDDEARQAASCEEITVGCRLVVTLRLDIRDDRNQNRKADKGNQCPKHISIPSLSILFF